MQTAQFQLHAEIEERHWWFLARRQIVRRLIGEVLPPSPQTTIVDVGCGTGANIASLADAYRCVGIDTSADAIRLARGRFPQVKFLQGFAPVDLGAEIDQARLVLMMDVLEHVDDDFALLGDMLSATQPGTWFLLTVPADMSLWSQHDESFGHYRRYDLQRFRRLWQDLPVTEVLASPFNSRLYPLVKLVRGWNRLRGHALGVAGTDFELPSPPVNRLLQMTFAAEATQLTRQIQGANTRPYRHGVSLLALLRRDAGAIAARSKPAELQSQDRDPSGFACAIAVS